MSHCLGIWNAKREKFVTNVLICSNNHVKIRTQRLDFVATMNHVGVNIVNNDGLQKVFLDAWLTLTNLKQVISCKQIFGN